MASTKNNPPPLSLTAKVEKLFGYAVKASATPMTLKSNMSIGKLFELQVLLRVLRSYSRQPGALIQHIIPRNRRARSNEIVIAGGPASADRNSFSHFQMKSPAGPDMEAWVSVSTQTLSWNISQAGRQPQHRHTQLRRGANIPLAALHELDVAVFSSGIGLYPTHEQLHLAISCKNVGQVQKECVREALGMRRETAFYQGRSGGSLAPWIESEVPTRPPSPLLLCSTDPGVRKYRNPVDQHGVYVRYIRFFG